jgi:hypothetical protein
MNNNTVLRDRTVRIIGIPILGIVIPNLTGLITNPAKISMDTGFLL